MPHNDHRSLHTWRLRARLLFKILLGVGFAYQSYQFVDMYLKYPAIVELDVSEPSELEMPAVTICNANEIRSSMYCERFPYRCGAPESDDTFCLRFEAYCKVLNNSMEVPLVNISSFRNLSRYDQQLMGHTYEKFVNSCTIEKDDGETNCTEPYFYPAKSFSNEIPFNCFTINSLIGKSEAEPEKTPTTTKIHLILNLETEEYHPSHLSRGAQLSLHTPYHIPSPTSDGHFLNLGNIYRMSVKLSDKLLLPGPYKSNCTDYISLWRENGGSGPVTERMCKEKCKLDLSLEMFNCVDFRIDYPHNLSYCEAAMSHFLPLARQRCENQCTSPCKLRTYEVQVNIADSEGSRKTCIYKTDYSCLIIVHIDFDNFEVITFKYKPGFEPIGILSFIGGYVGLWLGISLLTVYDFIETRMFRGLIAIRKKFSRKRKKIAVSNSATSSLFDNRSHSHKSRKRILYV